VNEEVGPILAHGGEGAHAAACDIDAPTLTGGVARPHERDRAPQVGGGAKTSCLRLTDQHGRGVILKTDPVEDVLSGRQALEQRFCGEIAVRQRIDERPMNDVLEAVGRRDVDQHARRPVGSRPHDCRIDRDVAGLESMADAGAIRRPADIGLGD
jgi:hypothetical protein